MKTVAILVAASPTRAFLSQVAVLKRALEQLTWSRWRYSLHLYLGGPPEPTALDEWTPHLHGVDIHWSSEEVFARDGDWAQSDDVFRFAPGDANMLLAMDADTIAVDALEPLLEEIAQRGAVAGAIAHYPPFPMDRLVPGGSHRQTWQDVAKGLVEAPLEFPHLHTLTGDEVPLDLREAPFYLNFGVVFFPRDAFNRVAPRYLSIRPQLVDRLPSPDFSGQVALTLAITATGTRTWALPLRYNFPNDPVAERLHASELEHLAVIHYLRIGHFDRHQIFVSAPQYQSFLQLDLQGINRRFQEAVRRIVGERYPFA